MGHFRGGVAHKGWGSLTDLEFFFFFEGGGGGGGKKGGGQYFGVGLIPWRTLCNINQPQS